MNYRYSAGAAALLIWGIFLLKLQLPIMLGLLAAVIGIVILLVTRKGRMDYIGGLVLLNFGYWLYSGLAIGSIAPLDLISIPFLNGEGRIFTSYFPLLLFSLAYVREYNLRALKNMILLMAMGSFVLYLLWMPTHAGFLSEGGADNFVGFLSSHTGSGTFFSFLAIFLIVYGYETRDWKAMAWGLLCLGPLFGSASREALLAFLVFGAWYMIKLRKWKIGAVSVLLLALAVSSLPVIAPHTWARTSGLFSMDLVDNIIDTAKTSEWEPGDGDIMLEGRQQNVLTRITFWTYALGRFAESPLVGIGFGRYNDTFLHFSGLEGLVYLATDGEKNLSVGNAHNSYIHLLCESGLIGLFLMLWLWIALYIRFGRAARTFKHLRLSLALFRACQGLVVFCMFAALTGHALGAPSLMIPVGTTFGIALAYHRYLKYAFLRDPGVPPVPAPSQATA